MLLNSFDQQALTSTPPTHRRPRHITVNRLNRPRRQRRLSPMMMLLTFEGMVLAAEDDDENKGLSG